MRSKAERLLLKIGQMVRRGPLDEWLKALPPAASRRLARKMAHVSKETVSKGTPKTE